MIQKVKPHFVIYVRPYKDERKKFVKWLMQGNPNWYKDFDTKLIYIFIQDSTIIL